MRTAVVRLLREGWDMGGVGSVYAGSLIYTQLWWMSSREGIECIGRRWKIKPNGSMS